MSFDSLNPFQFVTGFALQIKKESSVEVKNSMLQYMAELFEDANDFAWSSAKSCHAAVSCHMEEGQFDWLDTHRLDRCRRHIAQRYPQAKGDKFEKSENSKKTNFSTNSSEKSIVACTFYNKGTCSHKKQDHENAVRKFMHVCSTCFAKGTVIRHMSKFCTGNTKNE